ncbi:hypothetical protein [Xanthocytophaga agilis]|uniref:Uncharacterized protein n=1 Tax=Xanthocytophaga agilis TaxID=3048010 RepID=A0AAE3R7R7_9BACT|nr:hypothetical protein [Xanthocytophaga agilis]MDJ1505406.1 hypothetical protein [Xanthocytophaga agilis]
MNQKFNWKRVGNTVYKQAITYVLYNRFYWQSNQHYYESPWYKQRLGL